MKKIIFICVLLATSFMAAAQWKPVEGRIMTEWADKVTPENVLPEYPRPQMVRAEWQNLNGLWDYAIVKRGIKPSTYDGNILVPFAVESALSGVGKRVGEGNELWYHRTFTVPAKWSKSRIMLNFGAVDWRADVWVNGISVGSHQGGYSPFSLDITAALNKKGDNTLVVKVWDPTNKGYQPRGKQNDEPHGIWYTPVTGIWQTVWLEPVADCHIESVKIVPNLDSSLFSIATTVTGGNGGEVIEAVIFDKGVEVARAKGVANAKMELYVAEPKLWSPDSPYLYDVKITLSHNGKVVDTVDSYTAMRKFSLGKDKDGIMRMLLNNKPVFHFGPLDQGWWPDGLYTAPTDEALAFDVIKTKELGYNMIRKHVKVEPSRWYYHCDKVGMIVWQDMPSGGNSPRWEMHNYFAGVEAVRTPESEANFRQEWKEIMDLLYSHPSIGVWVPFNEAWGQFKTGEIADWTKNYDPSRLVNPASGGNHYTVGDILDTHHYPYPKLTLLDSRRATVLGEYGGIGFVVEGHLWEPDRNWGYIRQNSSEEVTNQYIKYAEKLKVLIQAAFAGAVYTQTTDVEIEVNGLMTYDRKVLKVDEERVRKVNQEVCNSLSE